MKIGLFDHIDRSDRPLAQQFDERLELVAAADRAGYYCYHVAEHHATPLNTVPVPGVYLGAVARATQRIHMGPMVYLLPIHSPLRVIEEICILDHLSHGRLEVGVGRGVSPFELNFHKVDPESSREIFIDAFDCVVEGLTHERLTHHGPYYTYDDVPMPLQPLQQPHPPMWYGSSNTTGSAWAGERGLHFTTNGGTERAKANIAAYRAALAKRPGGPAQPRPEFAGGAAIGITREIFIAETDAEAHRLIKPAHDHLYANQTYLRRQHSAGRAGNLAIAAPPPTRAGELDDAIREGSTIVGSPATVRAEIERQTAELGLNYLIGYFMFGTLALVDALRSLELFTSDVKPALERL
jgi:alkanesulfonate monooxygenase SsuD/methylene tetrahydromethanopterin reductase-like flavin-dependent oxidoreductase (luciferase family)